MELIQWEDSMSVGVEELDEQHKQLIRLINEAYAAVQRHDEHRMDLLIAKMSDYARKHFTTEEEHLVRCGYPGIAGHRVQHDKFAADVDEFRKDRFHRTNLSQIFVYLSRWLSTHIMTEDRKYSEFLANECQEELD